MVALQFCIGYYTLQAINESKVMHSIFVKKKEVSSHHLFSSTENDDDEDAYTGYKCARISIPIQWGNGMR